VTAISLDTAPHLGRGVITSGKLAAPRPLSLMNLWTSYPLPLSRRLPRWQFAASLVIAAWQRLGALTRRESARSCLEARHCHWPNTTRILKRNPGQWSRRSNSMSQFGLLPTLQAPQRPTHGPFASHPIAPHPFGHHKTGLSISLEQSVA
jgi:hypothetical protein